MSCEGMGKDLLNSLFTKEGSLSSEKVMPENPSGARLEE